MTPRVELKKSWTNEFGRVYPVGTVLQMTPNKASELIRKKIAEKYSGEYPPKGKRKINLSQLKK
jgi:hypothetical protein